MIKPDEIVSILRLEFYMEGEWRGGVTSYPYARDSISSMTTSTRNARANFDYKNLSMSGKLLAHVIKIEDEYSDELEERCTSKHREIDIKKLKKYIRNACKAIALLQDKGEKKK